MRKISKKVFSIFLFIGTIIIVVFRFSTPPVHAENRLYYLQVTLRNGERYQTISSADPFSYCSRNGGVVEYLRDGTLVFSPQMKVKILRTWIEPTDDLAACWKEILRVNGMLKNHNHKKLPRLQPLSLADMRRPE
jgi:hypothetical protein